MFVIEGMDKVREVIEKNRKRKYETGIEDTYGEGEGRVYESDEDPLDLYRQVEGKIEIKIRWQKNNLIEERNSQYHLPSDIGCNIYDT